jgi:hypothetical protein
MVVYDTFNNPLLMSKIVGMTGFEPAAPTSRTWCATGLRYIPKNCEFNNLF